MKNWREIEGFSSWDDQGVLLETILPLVIRPSLPVRIAEVGVYKGRMTSMWSGALLENGHVFEYNCVDNFQGLEAGGEDTVQIRAKFYENTMEMGERAWASGSKLIVHDKNSKEAAAEFEDGTMDIVYLDTSHDFDSVCADIDAWWPKVRVGGILCGDDYIDGWQGVVKAVNMNFAPEIGRVGRQQWYSQK